LPIQNRLFLLPCPFHWRILNYSIQIRS
jgi:hypothetical protein